MISGRNFWNNSERYQIILKYFQQEWIRWRILEWIPWNISQLSSGKNLLGEIPIILRKTPWGITWRMREKYLEYFWDESVEEERESLKKNTRINHWRKFWQISGRFPEAILWKNFKEVPRIIPERINGKLSNGTPGRILVQCQANKVKEKKKWPIILMKISVRSTNSRRCH